MNKNHQLEILVYDASKNSLENRSATISFAASDLNNQQVSKIITSLEISLKININTTGFIFKIKGVTFQGNDSVTVPPSDKKAMEKFLDWIHKDLPKIHSSKEPMTIAIMDYQNPDLN